MKKYKIQKIWQIELGIDGKDEYFLVSRFDDEINIDELKDDAQLHYTYESGNYFCQYVGVVMCEHSTNKAIITVHHQID